MEKLKQELQEVRTAAGTQGAGSSSGAISSAVPKTEPQDEMPALSARARGKAARSAAGGGGSDQLSFDVAALGFGESDRSALKAAVQSTRAIIAEHA